MITYNHEMYIAEAIEGIIMQKTTFPIRLVIGEDGSSDNTRKICEEYKNKYPELIELLPFEGNLGMMANFIKTLKACKGKYIALCEGDDYWTDSLKLQKQIDFLTLNDKYSICFHKVQRILDGNPLNGTSHDLLRQKEYNSKEILENFIVPTASVVFKNNNNGVFKPLLDNRVIHGDIILWLSLLQYGKAFCLEENMAVYRLQENSVTRKPLSPTLYKATTKHFEYLLEFQPNLKKIISHKINEVSWNFYISQLKRKKYSFIINIIILCLKEPKLFLYKFKNKI
nr:glycosyltransferase [Flammeovirga sp. SubArs3]